MMLPAESGKQSIWGDSQLASDMSLLCKLLL
ncbi:Uncharacterised protein [Hafnia alvei]|uniref:Uncharacterized protein n=1 Tax=Hafnia alvei TaxID=569 RepID=A0A377PQX3_HAFAL|nr:Uncharacterised protein [Hafnia alvei]STR05085.1 Uncharacterised protein [Hafnia alvei]